MSKKDVYELTNAQKSIWLTEQYLKGTSIGNISGTVFIEEEIVLDKLIYSIQEFVRRNDSMRTKIFIENGSPKQYFENDINFDIEIKKVSNLNDVEILEKKLATTPFSLIESNLFDFKIFTYPNGHGGVLISIHHIIGDAWTAGLIVNGVMDIYESLIKTNKLNTNESFSYKNYILAEKDYLTSPKLEKDAEFWNTCFDSIPSVAEIPSKKRLETSLPLDYSSKREEFILPKDIVTQINLFCKNHHISIFNFMMGIYSIYANRVCNLGDFVIGTPILNRTNFKEKQSTGMFISTIPFYVHVNNNNNFIDFVQDISKQYMQIFRHQKYPYQNLLQDLRKIDPRVPNLYDFLISYQNIRSDSQTNSIPYHSRWVPNGNVSDSLNIHLYDMNDVGSLNIAYDFQINKYSSQYINNMHSRILEIILQILKNENLALKDISILSPNDELQLQKDLQATKNSFDFCSNILEQIQKNAINLDKVAIETANEFISYGDLFTRVNKLANYLLEQGLQPNSNIGIFTSRTIDVIVGVLAVLKIGSTYVPIDPEYPKNRINYMIEKAGLSCILTDDMTRLQLVESQNIHFVDISRVNYENNSSAFDKNINYDINQNLYIVFTSGSTGNPKGVTISHKNMLNLIYFEKEKTNLLHGDNRILQFATMSFDVSYQEIFSAFLDSSTLVLVDEETRKDSYRLTDYLLEKKIDTLFIPPAYLRLLTEQISNVEKFKTYIKNIITAGEQLVITKGIRNLIMSGIKIHNHYGPAETHVATTYVVDRNNIELKPPIGSPISNTRIYILDNVNQICPVYTVGQIAIAGDCVGNGYFNNDDLTSSRFIPDIYSSGKMYMTGDLGYIDDKFCVHYLGRSDFQVKINGFRIELEEIDKVLMQVKGVQNAISVIFEKDNKKHIISYYSLTEDVSEDDLYSHLNDNLPVYMLPARLVKLERFPLTPNGKIDKKSLPKVDLLSLAEEFIEPRTIDEIEFAKIWKEIFNTDKISTNYNFFAIGGDSLLAIKLSAKILDVFKTEITVKDIFKTPVFSDLLKLIVFQKGKENKKIEVAQEKAYYPLSSAQKRIYYTNSLIGENNIVYNLPGGLLVRCVLDAKKVEMAFNKLIEKHTSFRTSFRLVNNKPMQFIENNIKITLDVAHDSSKNKSKLINDFPSYFDLSKAPLLHVKMYILDEKETLILLDTHHIIVDGTSLNIVIKDFCDIYNSHSISTEKLIDYKDYAVWENKESSFENNESIENYWLSKFRDKSIPVLNLPYDYPRPVVKSYSGNKIGKLIQKNTFEKYINFANSIGVSPYMFFATAFLILLYKYTNQENILIGTPIAGRDLAEVQNLVGMFVNNIVLQNEIDGNSSVLDLIEKVKKNTLDALSYQPYPYDKLVKNLNLPKDMSRNPLFDVMFIYQNTSFENVTLDNHKIKFVESKTNISKFDLSLEVVPQECSIHLEYCTDLFKKHTMEKFLCHYTECLENICENIEQKIKDVSILSQSEMHYLLNTFNATTLDYPEEETLSTLFEKQVDKTPYDLALTFHKDSLTFDELNKKANSLAYYLRKAGIGRNDIIGIMLPRSLELIVAMLAVLKSGATYIPIDPTYPKNRIDYMLSNSNAKMLLTSQDLIKNVTFENKLDIDLCNDKIYTLPSSNLENINEPTDSSYIIYTSGSTGLPKGVVLNHKALVNLTYYLNDYVDFLNGKYSVKNVVSVTTASFDIFIFETLICLQKGLRIVIADEEAQRVPSLLNKLLKTENIEVIQMTPSRMQFLVDNIREIPALSRLKYVVLAGEPLPINLLKSLRKLGIRKVYNGYGPSETTVFSTFTDVTHYRKMTIGKPLSNTQIYLLDKDSNLVPQGVAGELYISGDGVGNGYLHNKELTDKSFIPNPFTSGKLMYKTGDSGKILPNGEIFYLERLDNQVKIRGLRIELEEIENKILKFPGIQKVKVVKQTIQNREFVSAYFVANVRIRISDLRTYLLKQLPNYMVPSYFTALDDFPYTPNGKIDKKALPMPKALSLQERKLEKPKTQTQKDLVSIWEKILNVSPIGIRDNFFELGGDSILAMNLHIELLKFTNEINYNDIFSSPTIEDLSNLIDKKHKKSFEVVNHELKYKYKSILDPCTDLPKDLHYTSPRNILLSGVTGFLGAHILDAFLQQEQGNIYCLIRNEPGLTAHIKLLDKLHFYFGNKYDNLIDKRIFVIKSDIASENLGLSNANIENLFQSIDTVINCAAKVSHYGSYQSFYDINVRATGHLIDLCLKYDKKFYQVSTLSVSGNSFVDQYYENQNMSKKVNYRENKFYIGQPLNNVYIRTKFEAEKATLSAIEKGLDGYILRVGNLMPRLSDGKFQQNAKENTYLNRLLAFLELGSIPNTLLDGYLEFSPVDATANAILKLVSYPSKHNRVFHVFNDNHILIAEFLDLLKLFNYHIDITDEFSFKSLIKKILNDDSQKEILNNLINDFDKDLNLSYTTNIILKSELTKKYLQSVGFKWPNIDKDYVQKLIVCIENLRKSI